MVAGIFAAIMSSTDNLILIASSAVVMDVYKGVLKTDAKTEKVISLSTVWIVIVGALSIIQAMNPFDIIQLMITIIAGLCGASLSMPFVIGVYWKRCTWQGVVAGMISGFLCYVFCHFVLVKGGILPTNTQALISVPVSALVTYAVSKMSPPPSREELEGYCLCQGIPIDSLDELK